MTASNLIDMRTALFFLAVSNLMLAALMASHAHASNSNNGNNRAMALTWAFARTLQSCAMGLMCLRDILPDPLTMPLAGSLLILGVSLESRAVVSYWQQKISNLYFVTVPALAIILITLAWVLQTPAGIRILIISASSFLAILPIAHIYLRRWRGSTLLHRVITACTCLLLAVLVLRTLDVLTHFDNSIYSSGPPQFITVLALLLFTIFNGFAFMLEMHQQTERQLQMSETSLERAQSIALVFSWSVDFANGILHRQGATGHQQRPISGDTVMQTLFKYSPADEQAKLQNAWDSARLNKTAFDLMHRVKENGKVRWLHSRAEFEFNNDATVVLATGVTQDVTALREIQESLESYQRHLEKLVEERSSELREAEAQTRLILESTAEGMLGFDTTGTITFANRSACNLLGRNTEELVGKTARFALRCQQLVDDHCPLDKCRLLQALYSGEPSHHEDARFLHADGHFLPVSCSTQPMWRDGRIIGVVLSFVDITAQEQTRQAREQALAEAQRLAKVRSEFIANMSHEIRTPLNGVLGLAQIGRRDAGESPAGETFQRILDSGRHLLNVVNDILDFSKIEAGKLKLEDGNIVLGQLIDQVVALIAAQARQKGLNFRLNEALDLPRSFRGDTLRLSQVLVNLLGNAIKFTQHGSVTLSVTQEPEEIIFRVHDTGIGMNTEQLDQLFKAFEQADGTTTRRFGGTGLGLVISQRLTHLMGGEINVSSLPNSGSLFEVRLPLRDPTAAPSMTLTGRIHLVGIESAGARQLVDALQALGADASISTLEDACANPSDHCFVSASICADSAVLKTIAHAQDKGMKPVFVSPTDAPPLPPAIRARSLGLEEPLRLRHMLAALSEHPEKHAAVSGPKHRLRGTRILVAEDNAVNQLVLEDMLLHEGAVLVNVENGRLALEMVEMRGEKAFDVVLCDIQMPEMDGYEAARCINALAPRLPIIGLTAHAMPEEREHCLQAGMVEHISKPIDLELLVQTILHAVGGAAREQNGPHVTPATPVSAENAIIDWQALEAQHGTKKNGLIGKLIDAMLTSTQNVPEQLRQHASAGEWGEIVLAAHKLKGSCANLKALKLSSLASQTERAGRAELPSTAQLAAELAGATELLRTELEKRKGA